jgi:GAF domain-containing protein
MPQPTLGDLVESVGDPVLRILHTADPSAHVDDVVILDRSEADSIAPGAVVLGVGADPAGGDALALVDRAGRAGACAVVLRGDDAPKRLVELAVRSGVTVLAVPAEMPWGQLYSLLRTALSGAGAPPASGTAGVAVGDLFALADAVAAAVGAAVTIEDPQWRVLAYSNLGQPVDGPRRDTILGRRPPAEWQDRIEAAGIVRALRQGDRAVRFEHPDIQPRIAVPVRAGTELLGSMWAAGTLDEAAEQEFLQAGRLAAVHMVAHRASEDVERRARGAAVREVLEGRADPARLGSFGSPEAWAAIAFEPAAADGWGGDPDRVLSLIGLFAESVHRNARCAQVGDRLWALIPVSAGGEARLREFAARVVDRAEQVLGERLRAGIGCTVERLADVPDSHHAAQRALAVLAARDGRVAHIDDVRLHALLMELLEVARTQLTLDDGPIASLGEEPARTLRGWLDCHGDVTTAAERLGIHTNTLRYRLKRISATTGMDFADPDQRLLAEVQLRIRPLDN